MVNENFQNYYKENLQLTDEDFTTFLNTLEKPLPYVFRVDDPSLSYLFCNDTNFKKINYFENVYQCDVETYKKLANRDIFTNFIIIGKIYRQELVSMIPVHYLDTQENDSVLDMCAAPGSKSTQIIKHLKSGYLVSNDVNRKRAEILKSHINNYNKFNILITNNDARNYPRLCFDKILCDVPCSGDGTMRKNYTIRKSWKMGNMFNLQFTILKRGLEMLNDEGTLVYSTCSFNPVENEAVIQRAVTELGCTIVKVDKIKGLKMREGFIFWNPMVEKSDANKWLFPIGNMPELSNCLRILPQDNDTGGFFVAVLKKGRKAIDKREKSNSNSQHLPSRATKNTEVETVNQPFYQSPNYPDSFFDVSEETKTLIETQFDIRINYKMITQSKLCNNISLITNKLYEVMKSSKSLNIISGGCKSFVVNGHKGVEIASYRARAGILNLLNYDQNTIIHLKDNDAMLFLNNENVINEELSIKFEKTGIIAVKFEGREEYFCIWAGRNTSNLLVDKHYKCALKSILNKV